MSYSEHTIEPAKTSASLRRDWEASKALTEIELLIAIAKDPKNAGNRARNALEQLPKWLKKAGKTEDALDLVLGLQEETNRHRLIEADFYWTYAKNYAHSPANEDLANNNALQCKKAIKTLLSHAGESLRCLNTTDAEFEDVFRKIRIKEVLKAYENAALSIGQENCNSLLSYAQKLRQRYQFSPEDIGIKPIALQWMLGVLSPDYYGEPARSSIHYMGSPTNYMM